MAEPSNTRADESATAIEPNRTDLSVVSVPHESPNAFETSPRAESATSVVVIPGFPPTNMPFAQMDNQNNSRAASPSFDDPIVKETLTRAEILAEKNQRAIVQQLSENDIATSSSNVCRPCTAHSKECDDEDADMVCCLICFDECKPSDIVQLPCDCKGDNRFCMRCFDRALASSLMSSGTASCPTCRQPIEVDFNPLDGVMKFTKGTSLPEHPPNSPPGARLRDANRRVEETRTRIFAQMRPLLVERLSDFGRRRKTKIEELQEEHDKKIEELKKERALKEARNSFKSTISSDNNRVTGDSPKSMSSNENSVVNGDDNKENLPISSNVSSTGVAPNLVKINPPTVSSKPIPFIPRPNRDSNSSFCSANEPSSNDGGEKDKNDKDKTSDKDKNEASSESKKDDPDPIPTLSSSKSVKNLHDHALSSLPTLNQPPSPPDVPDEVDACPPACSSNCAAEMMLPGQIDNSNDDEEKKRKQIV
mgnify:CR=1 FL=1